MISLFLASLGFRDAPNRIHVRAPVDTGRVELEKGMTGEFPNSNLGLRRNPQCRIVRPLHPRAVAASTCLGFRIHTPHGMLVGPAPEVSGLHFWSISRF